MPGGFLWSERISVIVSTTDPETMRLTLEETTLAFRRTAQKPTDLAGIPAALSQIAEPGRIIVVSKLNT